MRLPQLTCVEDTFWVLDPHLEVGIYDFDFARHFQCAHPVMLDAPVRAIARMGAAPDYAERYASLMQWGIELIHTPAQYELTSTLPQWYPHIESLTPRSVWFDVLPTRAQIESHFEYPLFIKGERQTSKHRRATSIIEHASQLDHVLDLWRKDSILHWQRMVCRQFVPLRPVAKDYGVALPQSYEFRTFWWKSHCLGIGPYWTAASYEATDADRQAMLALGKQVTQALNVNFLVIDMAQDRHGRWWVIECNDGQDSGYAGVHRYHMWRRLVDVYA